jgi:hypothetical protein
MSKKIEHDTCLIGGGKITDEALEIDKSTGQQNDYVVICPEERAAGFVRPVRYSYIHKLCGVETIMNHAIAETYAHDPKFYSGTFCCHCRTHFDVSEFVWRDGTVVGS